MIICSSLKVLYLPLDPDYFCRNKAEQYYEGWRTHSNHPLFDEDLILLFDKVEGVEWGKSL